MKNYLYSIRLLNTYYPANRYPLHTPHVISPFLFTHLLTFKNWHIILKNIRRTLFNYLLF